LHPGHELPKSADRWERQGAIFGQGQKAIDPGISLGQITLLSPVVCHIACYSALKDHLLLWTQDI
jgi:hypothetical protein